MASERTNIEIDDDLLTCPICLEFYSDPILLQCYHTFCLACMTQLTGDQQENRIRCPLCHQTSKCCLQELKRNMYTEALLSFQLSSSKKICDLCESNSMVYRRCIQCDQFLCISCHNVHSKLKSTREHEVITFNPDDHRLSICRERFCFKHKTESLQYLCVECNIRICRDCKFTSHEGHNTKDISEVISDAQMWAASHVSALKLKETNLNKKLATSANWKCIAAANHTDAHNRLDCLERILQQQITKEFDNLRSILTIESKTNSAKICEYESAINSQIQNISGKQKYIAHVIEIGSYTDLTQLRKDMEKATDITENIFHKPDYKVTTLRIQPLRFQLKGINIESQDGFHIFQKQRFKCEETINKVVSSIVLVKDDRAFISFRNINHEDKSIVQRMVQSYGSDGRIRQIIPLPQQYDIALSKENRLLWYDEGRRKLFLYPPVKGKECKPIVECYVRPISLDIAKNRDIVCLDAEKKLTINFWQTINISMLVSPMYLSCFQENIWITDPGREQIVVLDKHGSIKFTVNAREFLNLGKKFFPYGICHNDAYECVFVSDPNNNIVLLISKSGDACSVLLDHRQGLESPTCLASKGNSLWVSDQDRRIIVYRI